MQRLNPSCTQFLATSGFYYIGFGNFFILKRGLFRKVHFLEILENPQTVENKGKLDHFLEILENLEILDFLEIPPVKRRLS